MLARPAAPPEAGGRNGRSDRMLDVIHGSVGRNGRSDRMLDVTVPLGHDLLLQGAMGVLTGCLM